MFAGDGIRETEECRVGAHGVGVTEELNVSDGRDKSDNFDAVRLMEPFLGDGTGSDAGNRLTGTTPATARAGLDAIFLELSPVGVRRAREQIDRLVAVVLGTLVLVRHGQQEHRRCIAVLRHSALLLVSN